MNDTLTCYMCQRITKSVSHQLNPTVSRSPPSWWSTKPQRTVWALGAQNDLASKGEQSNKKMLTVYKSRGDIVTAKQHVCLISLLQNAKAVRCSQLLEDQGLYFKALHPCRAIQIEEKNCSSSLWLNDKSSVDKAAPDGSGTVKCPWSRGSRTNQDSDGQGQHFFVAY